MNKYRCLTNDSSMASAIFLPCYAGLDVGQYLWNFNMSLRDRDSLPQKLVDFLGKTYEWKTVWWRDHFLIGGRIAWDFRRLVDDENGWGSKLMLFPESNNMTLLSIESSCWNNDFAIPYPTYCHPSKQSGLLVWQEIVRKRKRDQGLVQRIQSFAYNLQETHSQEDQLSIRSWLVVFRYSSIRFLLIHNICGTCRRIIATIQCLYHKVMWKRKGFWSVRDCLEFPNMKFWKWDRRL